MQIGQAVGPFTIEKELGSGAMGTVYRAKFLQDGKIEKVVALKVIALGLTGNEQALARFEREANILKQLRHPNIVRLLATGRYKGTPFFAMEYVNGRSFDKIMAERITAPGRAPFSWEEVVEYGKQLCGALQHAHEKGIIHRDLKPSNLMLTQEGILKLTDFGIAKDVDVTALTGANNTIGTAAYMSPEQCKGEKSLTGKSDLYSLGVVFYELLTGRKPFMAESSVDMFLMHVNSSFTRPAQLNPEIPVWLDTLVCQMMEKKPELRPRDATMVGQVLEEIAEKVLSQKSAGADIASARVADKERFGGNFSRDQASDRAAAKAIRAGAKKKKLKRKSNPVYRRGWFVSLAAIGLIAAFASFMIFIVFAPPTAESLLKKIEATSDVDKKQAAIADYLKHYADREGETTDKVRALDRDLRVKEREKVIFNRYNNEKWRATPLQDDDPDAYRKTMTALTAENEGDIAGARSLWLELEKYSTESDSAKALWGWLAKKKLADLLVVEQYPLQLDNKLNQQFRWEDKDIKLDDDLENRIATGFRLESLGDYSLARTRWIQLKDFLKSDAEKRSAYILASRRVRELESKKEEPKDSAARAVLLEARIKAAQVGLKDSEFVKRRDARSILRDIRDLYTGESGPIANLVTVASKLLADNPK
jgi:serine/threonine protein kinase